MGKEIFTAAGYNGTRLISSDGQTWSSLQTGKEGQIYRTVCFGKGICVAAGSYGGSNIFAATRDGIEWKTVEKDCGYTRYIRTLLLIGDTFFGFAGDGGSVGNSDPVVMRSTDGLTWSGFESIGGKFMIRRAAIGKDLVVGVGDRGRRAASPDGLKWKDMPDVKAIDTLVDVAYGNGVFVGVGLNGLRMTTRDGLIWSSRQIGEEGEHLNSILWTGSQFTAIGMGATYFSPDGIAWTKKMNHNAPLTAAFGSGIYVGAAWKGRLLTSTDAVEWRETKKCENHIETVGFGQLT